MTRAPNGRAAMRASQRTVYKAKSKNVNIRFVQSTKEEDADFFFFLKTLPDEPIDEPPSPTLPPLPPATGRVCEPFAFTLPANFPTTERGAILRQQRLWQSIGVSRNEAETKVGPNEYDYVRYTEYVAWATHMGGKVERRVITTLWS
jgi:hypothetical protein